MGEPWWRRDVVWRQKQLLDCSQGSRTVTVGLVPLFAPELLCGLLTQLVGMGFEPESAAEALGMLQMTLG